MNRQFHDQRIVIASHNEGKIKEISALLAPYGVHCESSRSLQLKEPLETGTTYLENALLKARAASDATGLCTLGDDSGIEVDAFFGEPGLHTAPYTIARGGREAVFKEWSLHPGIQNNPRAHFVCVLVLYWPDGHYENFLGRVSGRLTFPPRGTGGHGYDPVFVPDGHTITVAEMSIDEKNHCSHRYDALNQMVRACFMRRT